MFSPQWQTNTPILDIETSYFFTAENTDFFTAEDAEDAEKKRERQKQKELFFLFNPKYLRL
jgi:hypothetical protein